VYDRSTRVTQEERFVLTSYPNTLIEDIGTSKAPLPILYVPTEIFYDEEGNITALIAFHEGRHAKILKDGYDFGSTDLFLQKDHPDLYDLGMMNAVDELEGIGAQLDKGSGIMRPNQIERAQQEYMSFYTQLWRYGGNIDPDATEMFKERYFQSWMKDADSFWVREEGPNNVIKYDEKIDTLFYVCDQQECFGQFGFRNADGEFKLKILLPYGID